MAPLAKKVPGPWDNQTHSQTYERGDIVEFLKTKNA